MAQSLHDKITAKETKLNSSPYLHRMPAASRVARLSRRSPATEEDAGENLVAGRDDHDGSQAPSSAKHDSRIMSVTGQIMAADL